MDVMELVIYWGSDSEKEGDAAKDVGGMGKAERTSDTLRAIGEGGAERVRCSQGESMGEDLLLTFILKESNNSLFRLFSSSRTHFLDERTLRRELQVQTRS